MTSKFIKYLRSIGRKWFVFLVIIIIIVFIFNQIAALIMAVITLLFFILSYIPTIIFNKKLGSTLNNVMIIDDKNLARRLKQPLAKIQKKMHILSKNQAKKSWLIIYINKQYFYYNQKIIETFKTLFNKGYGEKEILEKLQNIGINTRAEIKAIEDALLKFNRLNNREVSVKEYQDKKRFA
ncbi:MAG: hypothetical protein EAX89_05605 [Candidatus Lokiarchaeota archaeon]|nr:hypothetical protein [Candidatus Lokiarchaeota archaeon]